MMDSFRLRSEACPHGVLIGRCKDCDESATAELKAWIAANPGWAAVLRVNPEMFMRDRHEASDAARAIEAARAEGRREALAEAVKVATEVGEHAADDPAWDTDHEGACDFANGAFKAAEQIRAKAKEGT